MQLGIFLVHTKPLRCALVSAADAARHAALEAVADAYRVDQSIITDAFQAITATLTQVYSNNHCCLSLAT